MKTGIYVITAPSGGQYVGSAVDFGARWRTHRHLLRAGKHHSRALQRAADKYGIEKLSFKIMIVCRKEDLIFFEQRTIDVLRPRYNSRPTAENMLGFRHSQVTIERCRKANLGRALSAERRIQISEQMKGNKFAAGKPRSPQVRAATSTKLKGRLKPSSPENRLTVADKNTALLLYKDGEPITAIAKIFGTDHRIMKRMLASMGATMRKKNGS